MAKTNKKTLARKRRQYKVEKRCLELQRDQEFLFSVHQSIFMHQLINDDYDQYNLDNGDEKAKSGSITLGARQVHWIKSWVYLMVVMLRQQQLLAQR